MQKICFKKNHILITFVVGFVLLVVFFSNKIYQSSTSYKSRASEVADKDKHPTIQRGFCYNDMSRQTVVQCGTAYPERIDYKVWGVPFSYDAMVYRLCPESNEQEFCQYMCVDVGKIGDPSDDIIKPCWTGQTNLVNNNSSVLIYNTSDVKVKINRIKHVAYLLSVTHADEVPSDVLVVEPKSFIRYRLKFGNKLFECAAEQKNAILFYIKVHYQDILGRNTEKVSSGLLVDNLCQSVSFNGVVYVSIP